MRARGVCCGAVAMALIAVAASQTFPSGLSCEDPRVAVGGSISGAPVQAWPGPEIKLEADGDQYAYGKPITITVQADPGSKFINSLFILQVALNGPDGGALGNLSSVSPDTTPTPLCGSSVYSISPFKGSSTMTWTPAFQLPVHGNPGKLNTIGNATFALVWAPGGAGQAYYKSITIWDPYKWNPKPFVPLPTPAPPPSPPAPPAPPGPNPDGAKACVDPSPNSFKASPVFVQTLEAGDQTFPSKQCVPCRFDQAASCKTAKVLCPTHPGQPVVEQLWLNSDKCDGEPDRVSAVDDHFALCPGPEHYHPNHLNMSRFVPKLQRDQPAYFKDSATAEAAIAEYIRMLELVQRHPTLPAVPSKLVDLVWHEHILDTQRYHRDCLRMFGRYMHHAPSFGGSDEKEEMVQQQHEMLQLYQAEFGEQAPGDVWPAVKLGEKPPDCCSAFCVKPECAGCVGCNGVFCGYTAGSDDLPAAEASKRVMLSPAQFAGYVPTPDPKPVVQQPESYRCSLSPPGVYGGNTTLSWTISGDYIHFKQSLNMEAWYGVGLNAAGNWGMGMADYMVTMHNQNYTGVKDMYLYDNQAGYPCWDVLQECSVGQATKGTKDVEDETITRTKGWTESTWNRKLVTGDAKDYPIVFGNKSIVLFAWGWEDYFNFHGSQIGECSGDLFSGVFQC